MKEHEEMVEKARRTHGLVAHNAAFADSCLFEIFHHYAHCPREFSRTIFFTMDSVLGKVALIKRVATVANADKPTLSMISKLGDKVKDAVAHRNGIAHSFLLLYWDKIGFDHHVQVINPKDSLTGDRRLTDAKLTKIEAESFQHLKKVQKEFAALCQKLGIRPQVTL